MRTVALTVLAALAVVACGGSSSTPTQPAAARQPEPPPYAPPAEATEDCSTRSEASFPGAFRDPRNLVVGPLVLVGGAFTDAETVREFGGNKFPLLVEAGHAVTIRIAGRARSARLAYGPLPQGEVALRDAYRSVTFIACGPGRKSERYEPDGPSGSDADGRAVTFWSGFVLTRAPACVPLEVFLDDSVAPRRVGLSLGRRC